MHARCQGKHKAHVMTVATSQRISQKSNNIVDDGINILFQTIQEWKKREIRHGEYTHKHTHTYTLTHRPRSMRRNGSFRLWPKACIIPLESVPYVGKRARSRFLAKISLRTNKAMVGLCLTYSVTPLFKMADKSEKQNIQLEYCVCATWILGAMRWWFECLRHKRFVTSLLTGQTNGETGPFRKRIG